MKKLTAKQVWVISWMVAIATAKKKSATTVSGGTVAKTKTTTEGPSIYCTDGGYTIATGRSGSNGSIADRINPPIPAFIWKKAADGCSK